MDWTTIGYVTLAAIIYILNFIPFYNCIWKDLAFGSRTSVPEHVGILFLSTTLTICTILLEGVIIGGLYIGTIELISFVSSWGIANFLLSCGIVATIIGGPFFAKPLAKRLLVGIPHYIQKFFTECKEYKAHLEKKSPIKRSVYELMEE